MGVLVTLLIAGPEVFVLDYKSFDFAMHTRR